MTGVNPFNFASWNLGGLNWNAFGEPNEVGLDDAPSVTTTPPPAQATDTVTIGSNFTFNLGYYQPPNGWSQSDIVDIGALVWDDEFIQDLNLQDPMFWLGSGDMFPEGRHRDLTEEQATAIDYQTYTTSLAKDLGVSWPKYQSEVESARQEFQNSNVQSHHQGGSYFFSLEPSARVTSHNANPIIERNENLQAANNLNQQLNDLKKSSKEDFLKLVQQLEANGYRVQGHKIGGAHDRNPNDSVSEVYQRRYYTLNGRILTGIGNANGAYPLGGMDGFQNAGWFGSAVSPISRAPKGVVAGGYSDDPAVRLQLAESLAKQFASAIGIKGAAASPGSNTEAGAAVFEEGGKVTLYWIQGSEDTVRATEYANLLMQANPSRKLLWVLHNHPGGSEFSSNDIVNGQALAFSSSPQLSRFQGLMLGKPDGKVSIFPAHNLREN